MKLSRWIQSLFQPESSNDGVDERPLSAAPLPSRMVPKQEKLKSPQLSNVKKPNAYDRTVDAILVFLDAPQNAALKQEVLQDAENFDLAFVVNKLQKAMQGHVSTNGLLWHGRDFGEALRDALYEIKKTAAPVAEEQEQMDVVLEAVGDKKVVIVQLLRQLTDSDLKQAMDTVDHLPAVVMKAVPPSKAASAQKAFAEKGAQVSLRPSAPE